MYITLVANPQEGFTVVGPLNKPDGSVGEWARAEYGGSDFYEIELQGHGDPKGTAVVFDGDIGQPFEFYGPFPPIEKAEEWVNERLGEHLVRARRAQIVDMDAIRDDNAAQATNTPVDSVSFKRLTNIWSTGRSRVLTRTTSIS